ncbi:FtsK/SpoIIIE domain-containing protein, partial [Staphylococcus sp. 231237_7MaSpsaltlick]|uniref:FtsK/SpoIIIE domain-containing protein n=1 Tax=Staphylococcus sp. 231237_7MaSpsaltlick TaxID=3367518 RepID=UPI00370B44B7
HILLIVGQTGSGKSLTMSQMILSGMFNKSPKDIQFAFYDPTRVEYLEYKNSPFLMKDIMCHTEELEEHLIELTDILDKRMKQLVDTKTIDIERYNKYARENDLEQLPYIITVIDEIAVPSCESPEIQEQLVRIMQNSRSVGIYFIIGTQTPNRNVINGTLKANIPNRIAMKVFGKKESMITIDEVGAEQLNGRGEMIYKDADG